MSKYLSKITKLLFVISIVLIALGAGLTHLTKAAPPTNFQTSLVIGSGLNGPSGFEFAPDGRIFIVERTGAIKIYKNGQLLPTPFATVNSIATGDRGLIGVTFDPNFSQNHYAYFYYTGSDLLNHLVRFDASGDVGTNMVELFHTTDTSQWLHIGGTVAFGPDGKLYLAIGDNGYPPNSQDLTNPHGKILRLNSDGTIPTDNPFYNTPGADKAIWAYGLRNPWRFQFDSATGRLYVGDVGDYTWEEVNLVVKGGNYGWPNQEGACTAACPYINPLYAYNHDNVSSAVTGGPVYHGSMFPQAYQGNYFFGDYARGFIRRMVLDQNGTNAGVYDFDTNAGSVVDLKVAPDGSLYYITYYPGAMYRITYSLNNFLPVANATSDVTKGVDPLTVHFSSQGSSDPNGGTLTYKWDFGDGTTSTEANPAKTYPNKGTYIVNLTVSNSAGSAQAVPITIQVGIPPTVYIIAPTDGQKYNAGDTIFYQAHATDGAGLDINDGSIMTTVVFHHLTHIHPFFGPQPGRTGSFTIPDTGEASPDTWYEMQVTATDTNGLSTTKSVNIYPNEVNVTFDTNPSNLGFTLDGVPYTAPMTIKQVVNFKRFVGAPDTQSVNGQSYVFSNWSDGGAQNHEITVPSTDATFTSNFIPQQPLPAGWQDTDIGNPFPGTVIYSNGKYTLKGAGTDIWYDANTNQSVDQFHYVYKTLSGDGEIVARITSQDNTDPWAKAGVMIKESATTGANYALLATTPANGLTFQYNFRNSVAGGGYTFPTWLRLKRSGNTFTSYSSTDGQTWTQVGSTDITMASNATVGLFITSHNGGVTGAASFDNVTVTQTPTQTQLPSPWKNTDLGAPVTPGNTSYTNGVFQVSGAGNDIWQTVDQGQYVYQPLSGDGEIVTRITSQTNTSDWAKAGVMIKESANANAPYVLLGATPANGLAFQYNFYNHAYAGTYTFPNTWLRLKRTGNIFTAYSSTDGKTWTQVGTTTLTMNSQATVGLVVTSHNGGVLSTANFDNVTVTQTPVTSNPLPSPWQNQDIGTPGVKGSSSFANNTYTLQGSGNDIWQTIDQFQYAYQTLNGDGEITARVTSQTNTADWAKAGVMIKDTTNAGSNYALMGITPTNGFVFQYNYNNNVSGGSYTLPNAYVRLNRTGNTFTAYTSPDGNNWTKVGSTQITMGTQATIGLFVTAHNNGVLSTATFDNVTVKTTTSTPPPTTGNLPAPWTDLDIGSPALAGSASLSNGLFTVNGSGNDIWFNADQFHFVEQDLNGNGQIIARVTSQTNTADWAKAGVMIKDSNTPLSNYALLGVTPANGINFQYGYNNNISSGAYTFPDAWLKLVRNGNTITAFTSKDGQTWTQVATTTVTLGSSVKIGLFVCSHDGGKISTVTFDNVSVTSLP